ncbi:MAG: hypothetical protein IKW51_02945 [Bacteroidales bacterium]|nr:hypothetical protein [Bacteroidales bacterium]
MKKYLFLLLMLSSVLVFSCGKSDDTKPDDETKEFYYVKYEASVSTSHIPTTYITVNTDSGINEFEVAKTFEEIFGPVSKDFRAEIDVESKGAGWAETTARIYISKNNSPFALKAYKNVSGSKVNLSYKIDF